MLLGAAERFLFLLSHKLKLNAGSVSVECLTKKKIESYVKTSTVIHKQNVWWHQCLLSSNRW